MNFECGVAWRFAWRAVGYAILQPMQSVGLYGLLFGGEWEKPETRQSSR